MPMRIYSEDNVRKRKLMAGEEKPTRKYTKAIKEEIKKEPFELSDNDDVDGDDVMDIEEADGTLPKKGKLTAKKRIMKTKKVKKILAKLDAKDKPKQKRKKKPQLVQQPTVNVENILQNSAPAAVNSNKPIAPPSTPPSEPLKAIKKVTKVKEKKIKPKIQKVAKKNDDSKMSQGQKNSDTDSSPEESDAYETCGVLNCTRPSGKEIRSNFLINFLNHHIHFTESVQDWILCDGGCEVWYHMVCVGLKIKEVKPDMEFICKSCKNDAQISVKQ